MNDFIELRNIFVVILRKWWLVMLFMVAAGAAGYLYSQAQTPIYEAKTTLIVGDTIQNSDVSNSDLQTSTRMALTYADIVRRYPVLQGAVTELGLPQSWKTLRKNVNVTLVDDTQLLEISVEDPSPEQAQSIAAEVARQLILLSPANLENLGTSETVQFIDTRLANLRTKIESGENRLSLLESIQVDDATPDQLLTLQNEINTLERLLIDWESNYTNLLRSTQVNKSANYLAVIEPAQFSSTPVRPNTLLNTLIALLLGLSAAVGLIFLLDFLDDNIRTPANLVELVGVPALGTIGRLAGAGPAERLLVNQDSFSQTSESYRLIRSKLQFMLTEGPRSFLITSPLAEQGRSTTAANLAVVMAQAGFNTIIVDADLRHPMQHRIFQIPNEGGLGQLLRYPDLKPSSYLKKNAQIPNLRILNSGTLPPTTTQALGGGLPPSPSELLGSQRMTQLLNDLSELADVVILDSPPAGTVADAVVLSNKVDGVILVLETAHSKREDVRDAVANLQQANAHLVGAVFNHIPGNRLRLPFARRLAVGSRRVDAHRTEQPAIQLKS
ncbi:MAG: polysaccharide biosynthesis tyrosine autokinase [Caldilineaceae bacterium]|nr:polysaccharide biosynthesis tyrosine autokinase [Caldilineaceae bacterium]